MPSAKPPFGDEVINASLAVFIAGIPVLDCAVFHLASLLADDLYNGGMKLVLIAHRGCASLKIAHIGVIVGHNQRSLKLAYAGGVDAEICAEFHRASHSLGDIHKRTVGEHCRV